MNRRTADGGVQVRLALNKNQEAIVNSLNKMQDATFYSRRWLLKATCSWVGGTNWASVHAKWYITNIRKAFPVGILLRMESLYEGSWGQRVRVM